MKSCFNPKGQEGVASIVKNPRGLPRRLYSVSFPEPDQEDNLYDDEDDKGSNVDGGIIEFEIEKEEEDEISETVEVGDELFLLGSNEAVKVGVITNVAECGSTGKAETVALALVRRPETILKQQAKLGLETEEWIELAKDEEDEVLREREIALTNDPLHRLEVVVGKKWLHGRLGAFQKSYLREEELKIPVELQTLDPDDEVFSAPEGSLTEVKEDDAKVNIEVEEEGDDDDEDFAKALAEAQEEAEAAAAEAKRKAEKMELLKKRAEEAMAARNKKREITEVEEGHVAAEATRKAEKMEVLRKRAEDAMAARKKNREES